MNFSIVRSQEFGKDRLTIDPEEIMKLTQRTSWLSILSHLIKERGTADDIVEKTGMNRMNVYHILRLLQDQQLIKSHKQRRVSGSEGNPDILIYSANIIRLNLCVDQFGIFVEYVNHQETKKSDYVRMEPKNN